MTASPLGEPVRILFFPDVIQGPDSGAYSARETRRQLRSLGYEVAVCCVHREFPTGHSFSNELIDFPLPGALRWKHHFVPSRALQAFKEICHRFRPKYVLFAGGIAKPATFARYSRQHGIKNTFLFYINDYFCARVYAGRDNGPCAICLEQGELAAVWNGCVRVSGLELAKFAKGSLVRCSLGQEIRRAYKVLSYSDEQSHLYARFGVPEEAIAKVGFQFDPSDLSGARIRDDGYFVLTGQPTRQKGFHLLNSIFARLGDDVKIKMSLWDETTARRVVDEFDLACFLQTGKLDIVTGLSRRSDYIDFIAGARGILLPSYYHTTGEFVLQESLFLGKPVHAFNVGAHRNFLIDGDNAFVSKVGDTADYASKIDLINRDINVRTRIGASARRLSLTFYTPDQIGLFRSVFV